jgi:hypothetical protein
MANYLYPNDNDNVTATSETPFAAVSIGNNVDESRTRRTRTRDGIVLLRDVFLAIDFDSALWDALFDSCSESLAAVARKTPSPSPAIQAAFLGPVGATTMNRGTNTNLTMRLNCSNDTRSISTLSSVLTFLQIDESTIAIPPEYLVMTPAWDGLEHVRIQHPHLHDCLLQIITMAVLRISLELFSQHVSETAKSLQDHINMLNAAIRNLTDINYKQLSTTQSTTRVHSPPSPRLLSQDLS